MTKRQWFFSLGFILLLLSGCAAEPPNFQDRVTGTDEQILLGVIEPLPVIDLYQSGTHQLRNPDGDLILLQSPAVNLNRYLGEPVRLRGQMAPKALGSEKPVFTVWEVGREGEVEADEWKIYENKTAGFTFRYPPAWELVSERNKIILRKAGRSLVTIDIESSEQALLDYAQTQEGTEGTRVTVGNQESLRYRDEKSIRFYVPNPSLKEIYRLAYEATAAGDIADSESPFYDLVQSFELMAKALPTGKRCGGPAKLKCEEGFRCELYSTDPDSAGVCVLLSATEPESNCPFIPKPENCEQYEAVQFLENGCPTRYSCTEDPSLQL